MAPQSLEILYEDNHLLAVAKPAGLATMGAGQGQPSLVAVAKRYVKQKYSKPGNVYLGVVSRLDAVASGVVVLARTSKAAGRLTEQFRNRTVHKVYWALVEGEPHRDSAACVDWLRKSERLQKMVVARPHADGAKEARLRYRILAQLGKQTLLEVVPETGRKHQIRLQLAHRGHPILGDRKYGSRRQFPQGIALHSRGLTITHPVKKTELGIQANVPCEWYDFGVREFEKQS